jgi:hypothetical protein
MFSEIAGNTATDSSGNNQHATLVNGPTWVAGQSGNAINLDGSDDYLSMPIGVVSGLDDFTIASWVRLNTTGSWRRLFDFGTGTSVNMFLTPQSGSNTFRFAITTSGASSEQQINGSSPLPTGTWTHVAVTKSGNVGTLYVNGTAVGTNSNMTLSPSSLGNTNNNWIGRSQYSGDAYLDGQVDDFRIYNRPLSASEVSDLAVGGDPTPTATATATDEATATPTPTDEATSTPTPTATPGGDLPAPWQHQDVGAVGQTGNAAYANGVFTIEGGGADIWGSSDEFHYVFQNLNGDGEIIAKVTSVENTNSWAKAGVMIRETLTTGSTHAMMVVTPGNGLAFQRRTSTGGSSTHTSGGSASAPYWVRLVRSGNTFTTYSSSNGASWNQVGADTIGMASNVYIGLAVTAHNDSTLCTAQLDNVSVSTGDPTPTPTATPTATSTSTSPTSTPTATPTPSGTGLLAWYQFDESSGTTAVDSSGSGNNATLVNGPTWVTGQSGNAVNLDGANDYVSMPNGIVNGLNNFTIATWVRLDTTGSWRRIFDFGTGTSVNMFLVPQSGSNTVRFAITTGGWSAEQQINGTSPLSTGVWTHVAVTKSGNVGTLYVNGVVVGTNNNLTLSPSSLGNTNQSWLGRSQYSGDAYLDGQLDDFRIYNRALSAAEINGLL